MNLIQWIHHFKVSYIRDDEYCIECPACGRDKLYFNVKKKLGHCHWDRCKFHTSPATVNALSDYSGFFPDEYAEFDTRYGSIIPETRDGVPTPRKAELPENAQPLILLRDKKYKSYFPKAVMEVATRINPALQFRYNLHFDGIRVYIPIYFEAKMVSYVGRAAWWFDHEYPRYEYPKGINVTNYLFDWDSLQYARTISGTEVSALFLVENTFNAIKYQNSLGPYNWTSTFGSHLSDRQIDLITNSGYEKVVLLWDGGTEFNASVAVEKLRNKGIKAGRVTLPPKTQPDDIYEGEIKRFAKIAIDDLDKGMTNFTVSIL